ncbi:hypothetical protein [Streptomyces lydicamycinicus]
MSVAEPCGSGPGRGSSSDFLSTLEHFAGYSARHNTGRTAPTRA